MAVALCLGVVVDSQHRIRDDRIDSREHLIWRMRDKLGNAVLAEIVGLWHKISTQKRYQGDGEEQARLLRD